MSQRSLGHRAGRLPTCHACGWGRFWMWMARQPRHVNPGQELREHPTRLVLTSVASAGHRSRFRPPSEGGRSPSRTRSQKTSPASRAMTCTRTCSLRLGSAGFLPRPRSTSTGCTRMSSPGGARRKRRSRRVRPRPAREGSACGRVRFEVWVRPEAGRSAVGSGSRGHPARSPPARVSRACRRASRGLAPRGRR